MWITYLGENTKPTIKIHLLKNSIPFLPGLVFTKCHALAYRLFLHAIPTTINPYIEALFIIRNEEVEWVGGLHR